MEPLAARAPPLSGELATLGLLLKGNLRVDMAERVTGVGDRDIVAMETPQSACYGLRVGGGGAR